MESVTYFFTEVGITGLLTNPFIWAFLITVFCSLCFIFIVLNPYLKSRRIAGRMESVMRTREQMRRKQRTSLREASPSDLVKGAVEQFNLGKIFGSDKTEKLLSSAGYRGAASILKYYFARGVGLIGGILVGIYLTVFLSSLQEQGFFVKMVVIAVVMVIGSYIPTILVVNAKTKRHKSINEAISDMYDLLLICVNAGMTIELSFNRVSQEIAQESIELAEEMSLTSADLAYLGDKKIALANLGIRTGHAGLRTFATVLNQSEKYGTSLSESLRILAIENRQARAQEIERKAASIPVKMTVPMILFFLPPIFIVLMAPVALVACEQLTSAV